MKKQCSSNYTVTLIEVLKSKPFDVLCEAAESGTWPDDTKHMTRDELADTLSKEMPAKSFFPIEVFISMLEETSAAVMRRMVLDGPQTLCVGTGRLPNGAWMALGAISQAGFDNPDTILKIVLSHLGIPGDMPIRLSFADQSRFAA